MPPADLKPGSKAYADWAVQQAKAGKSLPTVSEHFDFEMPTAESNYYSALENYRRVRFPERDPDEFRQMASEASPTLIPGISMPGPLAPYGATQMSEQGLFFGLNDEMNAGIDAAVPFVQNMFGAGPDAGEIYNASLALEQARRDFGREQLGGWGTLAEVAGGLASGGTAAKTAAAIGSQAPGMLQTLKGLTGAAASGGAYGFGATDGGLEQRLPGAAMGAGTGLAVGVAAPIVARGAQKFIGTPAANRAVTQAAVSSAPTAAAIKAASKASYKAAERTGAVVDGSAVNLLNHDVRQFLTNEGMLLPNGQLIGGYAKVGGALDALQQFGANGSMTVKQAMTLNRTFRNVAKSTDPAEGAIGAAMVRQLDGFFENLPVQAFSTNGKAGMDAVRLWGEARKDWSRFRKTETIEKAIYDAGLHQGGFAKGLRGEFGKILKSTKKRRGFDDAELSAMERYVQGGTIQGFLQDLANGGSIPASVLGLITGGPVAAFAAGVGRATAGKLAGGTLNRGASRVADIVRAQSALPNGLPVLPRRAPPTIEGNFRRVAVGASNPVLGDQRQGLSALLSGYGVAR